MRVAGAEALNHTDALVAGDERRRRLDRPLPARGVDDGVTQPRRLDAHEDLLGTRLGDRDIFDDECGREVVDDGGLHGELLCSGALPGRFHPLPPFHP
jgi:hypothetical protein